MPEDYFGERVAARFDERYAYLADPAVVDPMVDFLVERAGDGAALELGIGTGRIALPLARRGRPRTRDRALGGDGGAAADEAGRGGDRRHDRRLRDDSRRRHVPDRLPRRRTRS
jgi:hypothetical protein